MTEVARLFQMAGTAELKARPPYAVLVRGAWSRGRVDERNVIVIDEAECWLEISWRRYSGWEVDYILKWSQYPLKFTYLLYFVMTFV